MSKVVDGLYYTKDHEWVKVEGEVATLGITDYAQENLGDVVFVELPEIGSDYDAGATAATIESVKAVAEVYAPFAAKVSAVNEALSGDASVLNQSPYEDGWLVKLDGFQSADVENLMSPDAYQDFLKDL